MPMAVIPEDDPSAGVALAAALTSLYTRVPVRSNPAMTAEITLTKLVLSAHPRWEYDRGCLGWASPGAASAVE